jgi:hypothetical protein
MIAEIELHSDHEVWKLWRNPGFKILDWAKENNPLWEVDAVAMINDPSRDVTRIGIRYEPKPEGQLFRERFDVLINGLPVMEPIFKFKKEKAVKFGCCPECDRYILNWEPMFGGLAPEWWATMRERGIDPATGHSQSCRSKQLKY